jgi:inner membrane protein
MGVTLGTLAARDEVAPGKQVILTAVIASNLPDFDFFSKFLYGGSNLAYLLQHRGWSHTVLLSPVLAIASVWLMRWILVKKKVRDRAKLKRLFQVAWAAVFLHLFADYWNDYGVHPFSPFNNRWFYGDFMFIIEPALWLAMLPLAFYAFPYKWTKVTSIVIACLGGALALFGPQGGIGAFFILLIWGGLVFFVEEKHGYKYPQGAVAAAAVLVVLLVFRAGSAAAHAEVEGNLDRQLKNENTLQTVLSPFPGNPFLWRAIVATSGPNYSYIVRLGTVSVIPGIKGPLGEYYGIRMERMAPMVKASVESDRAVYWIGEFRGSLLDIPKLAYQSCEFENFLKWARVPFWLQEPGRTVAGDLRYDHEKGMGFAKVELTTDRDPNIRCPTFNAPWEPPLRFTQSF